MMISRKLDDEEGFDDKYALLQNENLKLQDKLKNYNNIQQELISANYLRDKQLESYKKLNFYIKSFIQSKTIQNFKSAVSEAVVDIFSAESSMVVFVTKNDVTIYTEGLEKKEHNPDNIFRAIENITLNVSERAPFYLTEKHINNHPALEKFERILVRKFESKEENFQFFIIGMVSKKMAFSFDKLNYEGLLMFDNFSEQIYSILKHRLYKENLIEETEKYRNVIAKLNLGLLELDNTDKILYADENFCKLLGYTNDELKGKYGRQTLFDDESRQAMSKHVEGLFNEDISFVHETEMLTKQGEKRNMLISAVPNYSVKGEIIGAIGVHLDITNQKNLEKKLFLEKEKYRSIIANMNLGLLEVDNYENILLANNSFCEISGYTEDELIGKNAFNTLLNDKGRISMKKQISIRLKKESSVYEAEIITKQGEKRTWLISGAPNFGVKGELVGSIGIHLDITNQKNLESKLLNSNNNLKKINKELDTFVYRISHDLRTPVLSIMGLIDLIQHGDDVDMSDRNKEYINLMLDSTKRLDKTIQEILYFSRNSKLELQIQSVDIQKLINHIYDDIKYVNKRDIIFETNFNNIHFIDSDKARLEIVLKNILSNSVKYFNPNTDKCFVKFDISQEKTYYTISITDNGIGIEKEFLDRIFEMFFRATNNAYGTGLGLFLVKETIEKLKGRIKVDSQINVGTKFIITIPKKYN
ncbi:MAG: PAS domain-containing sensor histidine kinase [Flavobacteriaceae bacterium]|nr:PAS domain-containing sensor histidine kinase [Flavobacteriaceae bacterium]